MPRDTAGSGRHYHVDLNNNNTRHQSPPMPPQQPPSPPPSSTPARPARPATPGPSRIPRRTQSGKIYLGALARKTPKTTTIAETTTTVGDVDDANRSKIIQAAIQIAQAQAKIAKATTIETPKRGRGRPPRAHTRNNPLRRRTRRATSESQVTCHNFSHNFS